MQELGIIFEPYLTESASELYDIPKPPMLIDGLIPQGAIVMVSAPAYTGKTFFALETARSVGMKTPFMGEFEAVHRGNVLIIEQDSPRYDTGRAMWSMLKESYAPEAREILGYNEFDTIYFTWHPEIDLQNEEHIHRIVQTANGLSTFIGGRGETYKVPIFDDDGDVVGYNEETTSGEYLEGCSLIIFDTLRSMHSAEENESGPMEAILQRLKWIRSKTGATVMLLHHDSKNGEGLNSSRGSTAIPAAVDNYYSLRADHRSNTVSCITQKARAIQSDSFKFRIISLEENGTKKLEYVGKLHDSPNETMNFLSEHNLYTFIASEANGITTTELLEWAALNQKSESTVRRWLATLVRDEKVTIESFVDNGRQRSKYHAVEER